MKLFTTVGIVLAFGLLVGCSSDDSDDTGTGGTSSGGSSSGGTSSGGSSSGGTSSGGTSSGGTSSGGSAGAAGAAGSSGSDCTTCVQAQCQTEVVACAAKPECLAIVQCAAACTTQACVDACVGDGGGAEYQAVSDCANTKCAAECAN